MAKPRTTSHPLPLRRQQSQRGAVRVILPAAILFLLVTTALAWWLLPAGALPGFGISVRDAVALIDSWGAWGVAGSIGLMVVHSFVPFPAEVVALANGMVYGPVWGAVITWIGAMLGGSAAFGLTRWIGQPLVTRLLSASQQTRLATWSTKRGGIALLLSRLMPLIAFNLINYAAGLTGISWWTFLWATGLGILPFTILLAILGDHMLTMPSWAWLVIGAMVLLAYLLLDRRWREATRQSAPPTGAPAAVNDSQSVPAMKHPEE